MFTPWTKNCVNCKGLEISFFKTSDYVSFKDVNPEPVEDTCKWFFNDPQYSAWINSENDDLLWLSADPGCGKSVLSKAVVDRMSANGSPALAVYFFFKASAQQDNASVAICALLHQLYSRNGRLFKSHAVTAHELQGNGLTTDFEGLWDLFIHTVRDHSAGNIVCVLDGLDECRGNSIDKLIRKLKEFYNSRNSQRNNSGTVKFLITSRPYQDMIVGFNGITSVSPSIRLAGEEKSEAIGRDIALVLRSRMKEIGESRKIEETQVQALTTLLEMEDRTYIWLKRIFEEIYTRNPGTPSQWNAVIQKLPLPLEYAYESMLSRSPDRDRATKVLQMVLAAQEPLTLSEMDVALSIEDNFTSYDDLELGGDDYTAAYIRDICGLFLRVVESKIYLIHPTAREFLVGQRENPSTGWKSSLVLDDCHLTLAQTCMRCILFAEFRDATWTMCQKESNRYPFLRYALCHWPTHFRESNVDEYHELTLLATEIYDTRRVAWSVAVHSNLFSITREPILGAMMSVSLFLSKLDIVFLLGHDAVLRKLKILTTGQKHLETGISQSAFLGPWRTVNLLCAAYANISISETFKMKEPLHFAVKTGHLELVKLMLAQGANVNSELELRYIPLHRAAENGHDQIIEALAKAGAHLNASRQWDGTALHLAAREGHEKAVATLIGAGADINAFQQGLGTALHLASSLGHEKIVRILVEAGADVDIDLPKHGTAFYVAAARGHDKIVMFLRPRSSVDINCQYYWTSLIAASLRRYERVITLFLDIAMAEDEDCPSGTNNSAAFKAALAMVNARKKSPELNVPEEIYRTMLKAAAARGDAATVGFLLDAAGDIGVSHPAFRAAAAQGHLMVVDLFLERIKPTEIDTPGKQYGCAIHAAAAGGHQDVVERLLMVGADAEGVGLNYGTALHVAARKGHTGVVETLIQRRCQVNAHWKGHGTPLHAAAEEGHERIVEMLLEAGADVNIENEWLHTACELARRRGHPGIVKILLEAEQSRWTKLSSSG